MIALLYLGLLVVAFFLLIVRPQRRQMAAHRALVASLEVGEEVITSGGVYGTIRAMDQNVIELEIADAVIVRVARNAVASKAPRPDDVSSDDTARGEEAPRRDGTPG